MQVYRPTTSLNLRVRISIGAIGAYPAPNITGYRYSDPDYNTCQVSDFGYVSWGTSDYSTENDGIIRVTYDFLTDNDNLTYTLNKEDIGYNLCKICNANHNCWVIDRFSSDLNTNYSRVLGYIGAECWIELKPYDLDGSIWFHVVPGRPLSNDSSKIDLENMGNIYFLGRGDAFIPLFTVNGVSGNYADVTYNIQLVNDYLSNQEHHFTKSVSNCSEAFCIDTVDDSLGYLFFEKPDINPDPSPDDGCGCEVCYVDPITCCYDDVFTGDLNEFSSLKSPDTYINPENGEEERLPWNGCLHISRALEIGFKVFYAFICQVACIWECLKHEEIKRLDRIASSLEKLEKKEVCNYTEVVVDPQSYTYCGRGKLEIDNLEVVENG